MASNRSPLFAEESQAPQIVGQLGLVRFDPSDDPDRGTIFRYEARTEGAGWLGVNTFLYDRALDLTDGHDLAAVGGERDRSLKLLRANAVDPTTIGCAEIKCQLPNREAVHWQWAAVRDKPESDGEITHVAVRVDRGYFNKVLYTYPAAIDSIGRGALVEFLDDWHRVVSGA